MTIMKQCTALQAYNVGKIDYNSQRNINPFDKKQPMLRDCWKRGYLSERSVKEVRRVS